MKRLTCVLTGLLLVGCAMQEPALPPVPPMVDDLSTWAVPELVQPPTAEAPLPEMPKEKPSPAEKVFSFQAGTTSEVTVPAGVYVDFVLGPGEQSRNIVGAGAAPCDKQGETSAPWCVQEGGSGQGETLRHHVFVTAHTPGQTLALVITTTGNTYHLTLKSVKASSLRVVRWTYPVGMVPVTAKAKEPGLLPDPTQAKRYHVGYEVKSSKAPAPDWLPRGVFDDGKKLYLVYPEVTLFGTVPVVRMIGPNGPQILNLRQYLNVVILDQLAPRLELRVGIGEHAEVVTITRGALRTIECPGDAACPVWPAAAQTLAGRTQP